MIASSSPESDDSGDENSACWKAEKDLPEEPLLINRQRVVRAHWDEVRHFLRQLHFQFAPSGFSVCLLSDRGIRRYNRQFRHQDQSTDVLSLPAQKPRVDKPGYLGDILISTETAEKNAPRFGLRLEQEIQILVLHGLLHLLGYDHETDHGQMARQERRWRKKLGLPLSLTERSRPRSFHRSERSGQHRETICSF